MKQVSQPQTNPDFVQNPYAFYDEWRDDPFFFWKEYGIMMSARFAEVNALFRDRRFGREAPLGFEVELPKHLENFYAFEERSILELEPPSHTRIRGQILRSFTSRRIQSLSLEIEMLCAQLLANFPQGEFDLMPYYSAKIPVIIIARLIGIDEEDCDQLLTWSHDMVSIYQANRDRAIEDKTEKATIEFTNYIKDIIEVRKLNPRDDLITHLISIEGEKLNFEEIITTIILLLNAGHETTVHSISNAVKIIIENGVKPDIDNIEPLVEETLRLHPPVHMFTRFAMEDVEVFGHKFNKGDKIGLLLAAANRDPNQYEEPHVLDVTRKTIDHISFGGGIHFCIGAPLARLELSIALKALFRAFPNITMTKSPIFANRFHFHGLEALWVKT